MIFTWWLRLRWWEWRNRWRVQSLHRGTRLALWFLPFVALPLVLRIRGRGEAAELFDWVLSFDVPLALVLSAVVAANAAPLAAGHTARDEDPWLATIPRSRWLRVLQWSRRLLQAGRGAWVFACTGVLLGLGIAPREALVEWLVITALALTVGALFAHVRVTHGVHEQPSRSGLSGHSGVKVLPWLPLHAVRQQINPRRLMMLGLPIMLVAPMGVSARQIGMALSVWLPLALVGICCREATAIVQALHRWLPGAPRHLRWHVWRYVLLLLLGAAGILAVAWKSGVLLNTGNRH